MPQISPQAINTPRAQGIAAARVLLAADIGGTHARVGLVRARRDPLHVSDYDVDTLAFRQYACVEYPSLVAILRAFLHDADAQPVAACIACAGYVHGDTLINANLPWPVSVSALARELELDRISVVNDFEALAYAAHADAHDDGIHIAGDAELDPTRIRITLGPGTGLGAAVLLPGTPRPTIFATEAGHAALAPRTALESEILGHLGASGAHVPNETVLSGPGLMNLYRALCALRKAAPKFDAPAQITQSALDASDALALETVEVFCAWLGSLVGDLVMLFGAFGGVILAGGVLPQMLPLLQRSAFAARLADKGTLRDALARVPVRLIEHGQLGVTGAARWHFDRELEMGRNLEM